jgi:hypothetical protein
MTILKENQFSCIICGCDSKFFFSKNYQSYPGSPFADDYLVSYYKCTHCGFVISKTHLEMTPKEWSDLNSSWHHNFESSFAERTNNQPPYAEQALALMLLFENDILDNNDVLDFAAGYGSLAKILKKYFNKEILLYDKYVNEPESSLSYVSSEKLRKYKLVINSAMFEHVLNRSDLDAVNALVSDDGVLMLHTVVCERVPQDPKWFYIEPMVHTAFHTNRSMSILMNQWGYTESVYSHLAKSWFLFKEKSPSIENLESNIIKINKELQSKFFHHKRGFLDYWKGF